jgi:archaellum component FlaF (FlaF/FlaG flagellin family)
MGITLEDMEAIEKRIFDKADNKYVHIDDCNEKQERVNNMFAKDNTRIEIISHDFAVVKKLMWAVATASIGSLVVAFFELILK